MSDTVVNKSAGAGAGGAAGRAARAAGAGRVRRPDRRPDRELPLRGARGQRRDDPDSAVPYLLLEVSQLLLAGGRLGAHEDIVPDERYEPDAGPEPDEDDLRQRLAGPAGADRRLPRGLRPVRAALDAGAVPISDDLADVVADLRHGMAALLARAARRRRCGGGSSRTPSNWGPTASASAARAAVAGRARTAWTARWTSWTAWTPVNDEDDDDELAEEAGRVMEAELGTMGLRPAQWTAAAHRPPR